MRMGCADSLAQLGNVALTNIMTDQGVQNSSNKIVGGICASQIKDFSVGWISSCPRQSSGDETKRCSWIGPFISRMYFDITGDIRIEEQVRVTQKKILNAVPKPVNFLSKIKFL